MPYAVALRLDDAAARRIEAMRRALAERGVADDALRLGYPPHLTLAVCPDGIAAADLGAAVAEVSSAWHPLPVTLAGVGAFPGAPSASVVWLAPVPTADLLARHASLLARLGDLPVHGHYRPGAWVPHVTLLAAQATSAARAIEALAPLWDGPITGLLARVDVVRFHPVEVLSSRALGR
jgi:2'-5' RNA ligase